MAVDIAQSDGIRGIGRIDSPAVFKLPLAGERFRYELLQRHPLKASAFGFLVKPGGMALSFHPTGITLRENLEVRRVTRAPF